MYNEGNKSFTSGEALEAYRRVKLSTGSGSIVEYADAGENFIGVTLEKVEISKPVALKLRNAAGTVEIESAEAFDVGATLYGADDGKVQDTSSGDAIATALDNATADGCITECLLDKGEAASIDGATIAVEAEAGNGAIPVLLRKSGITDAGTPGVKISDSIPFACKVIDWWIISRDTSAANVKLTNGTDDIAANVAKGTADDTRVQGATIVAEKDELAAGSDLIAFASAAAAFDIFVLVEKI